MSLVGLEMEVLHIFIIQIDLILSWPCTFFGSTFTPPNWISLNNSKMIKFVTLEFYSIYLNSIRDIYAKFGIHNLPQSSNIGNNSGGGISDFRISGQSLINENCHDSRASDDIDMKLGAVTKIDKRNKTTSKNFDVDVMSTNYDVIVIFRIFGQFGAVQRADSGHRVCKSFFFSNSNLFSYKN